MSSHNPLRRTACLLVFALLLAPAVRAQEHESALSNAEIEKLRDTAYVPIDRVAAFMDFLNQRTHEIEKLNTGKRRPGREEDIHDLMEQFASIGDDFDDNLEDYNQRHLDIRKVLPKVIAAAERWGTELRTPPDHEAYTLTRKLALETLTDIRETAAKVLEEQKAWFLAHPPPKDPPKYAPPQ